PTRYRPSSEALLRRVLKGEELAPIHPLVDLNNALSIELAVPSCIMANGTIEPPVALRAGAPGETFESLRGPFSLEGKPLLADPRGPFGTPITDSLRVKVQPETAKGWLVAYLPEGVVSIEECERAVRDLAARAGIEIGRTFAS
ncbi:MAG TPA: phenylalanine--tRNA ligase beta subunit-related protein, partial [Thermoanaerobaculia bacterium]|nr:phenylalanine--tRNA ligase beta subunit-related protein [Thermoanaerobaculia bacterium]